MSSIYGFLLSDSDVFQARRILKTSKMNKLETRVITAIEKTLTAPLVPRLEEVGCGVECNPVPVYRLIDVKGQGSQDLKCLQNCGCDCEQIVILFYLFLYFVICSNKLSTLCFVYKRVSKISGTNWSSATSSPLLTLKPTKRRWPENWSHCATRSVWRWLWNYDVKLTR